MRNEILEGLLKSKTDQEADQILSKLDSEQIKQLSVDVQEHLLIKNATNKSSGVFMRLLRQRKELIGGYDPNEAA